LRFFNSNLRPEAGSNGRVFALELVEALSLSLRDSLEALRAQLSAALRIVASTEARSIWLPFRLFPY
jgi:hypothetical protein